MSVTEQHIRELLTSVQDPELQMSIVNLGLVYEVNILPDLVFIRMGLTTPFCPFQDRIRGDVIRQIKTAYPALDVGVEFILDPPWTPQKATLEVQQEFALRGIPLTRL